MKTAIELLQKLETHLRKLRPLVFNTACADDSDGEHLYAALHIADDLRNLTSLKSLEGPRLTVDEIMEVHRKWLDEVDCYDDWNKDAFVNLREALTKSANP